MLKRNLRLLVLNVSILRCFLTCSFDALLLILLLLLLVDDVIEQLSNLSSEFLMCKQLLFFGAHKVIIRIIDALRTMLNNVEVVDPPSFGVRLNDSVVTKMLLQLFQHLRCDTVGEDVRGIVVGRHSLDVDKACGLDVLDKEVAQGDALRAIVESKLVAETLCRCSVGEDVKG